MRTLRTFGTLGIAAAAALLLAGTVAFAEERSANAVRGEKTEAVRVENVKAESANAGPRVKSAATTQGEIKEVMQARLEAARDEAKQRVEAAREEAKTRIETVREEAKARIEAQREKATQRLADIQDKTKKQLAERLAKQFEHLNKTWTDHFMKLLNRYDEIVLKMRDRASAAAGNGRDVTAALAAIQSAETAIQTARTAVVAQAAKTYVLDTSAVGAATATTTPEGQSEMMQKLRGAFQNLHAALFRDLFALRDGPMRDARAAVQRALQALGQVPGVDNGNATSTAQTNQ